MKVIKIGLGQFIDCETGEIVKEGTWLNQFMDKSMKLNNCLRNKMGYSKHKGKVIKLEDWRSD